ncbi:tyrosine-type recombinase/integrase [Candidatus Poriferisodalis sp.]|uniref:tyrosine-type recombinase/integrase n=1 Tax=Candidatus Poriferisodalis sp. TaxID=3101277 RepID=UPI003B58FE56
MSDALAIETTSRASAIDPASHAGSLFGAAAAATATAISTETHRAYSRALRQVSQQLAGRPIDDHSLSEALAELAADGAGRSKLGQIVAAVRFSARLGGLPDPVGPSCDAVLRAHRRSTPAARQVAAVDWADADAAAAAAASEGTAIGLRNAALISVMSDALLRVSEAAALRTDDIERRNGNSATLTVRFSKTDQDGEGASLYLGAPTVRRVDAWIDAANSAGADMTCGPLYRRIRRGQRVTADPLSPRSVREIVRRTARVIGVEGASGHSLRVGSAVSLVRAGASLVETQQAGRWASPTMPAHYARCEIAARGAVARLRHGSAG